MVNPEFPFIKKVVLISGKQGSGKSTIGFELKKMSVMMGVTLDILKFAYPLYEIHHAAEKIMSKYGAGWKGIDGKFLQVIGTEWGRAKNQDLWVNTAITQVRALTPKPDIVVFDDCRFKNEIDAFNDLDVEQVLRVRLECPEEVRKFRASKWRASTEHKSETELDGFPFDLVLHTNELSAGVCGILIMTALGYNVL